MPMLQKTPDYLKLLADKYSTEFGYDCDLTAFEEQELLKKQAQTGQTGKADVVSDDDDEKSEDNLLMSKARGRHQSQAASLRISKIEKILSKRTDLTMVQRRKLQSRKNTAHFRERQKNSAKLKEFIHVELDMILEMVGKVTSKAASVKFNCKIRLSMTPAMG